MPQHGNVRQARTLGNKGPDFCAQPVSASVDPIKGLQRQAASLLVNVQVVHVHTCVCMLLREMVRVLGCL